MITEAELRAALDACDGGFAAWRARAGEGRLAGDARPRAHPHAALSARHAGPRGAAFGAYPNPEDLAFARPAARVPLYHVAFDQPAVWQEGRAGDELLVEIYEHWLEPGMTKRVGLSPESSMNILETDGEKLLAAVRDLLAAKGLVSNAEIAERIAITDAANPGQGARMVAKAWTDPAYRALMLEDGTKAAEELGIPMRGAPPLGVLENTAAVHNLVVCTLCSCYPRAVLGYPPFWFKSAAYRARAVRDPRGLIAEWGTVLPDGVKSALWIPPRTIAGWCCRAGPPAPKAGAEDHSPRSSARAT